MKLKIICSLTILISPTSGLALDEIFRLTEEAVVFLDRNEPDRFLALNTASASGKEYQPDGNMVSLQVANALCVDEDLVYRHPYLVGTEISCKIDESQNKVDILRGPETMEGSYAIEFLAETEQYQFYLINGRKIPDARSGYIMLKRLDKIHDTIQVLPFITDVPGFSGGMAVDRSNGSFVYTQATGMSSNLIYRLDSERLLDLAIHNSQAAFAGLFESPLGPLRDLKLSFKLFADNNVLIYDNRNEWGNFESYLVYDAIVSPIELPENCRSLGIASERLFLSCDRTKIVSIGISPN
ncbi:MAG: hypothetical protein AB7T49_05565 [Oligoflexales bacterium]